MICIQTKVPKKFAKLMTNLRQFTIQIMRSASGFLIVEKIEIVLWTKLLE